MLGERSIYIGKFSDMAEKIVPEEMECVFPSFGRSQWSDADILVTAFDGDKPVAIAKMSPNPYAGSGKPEMFLHFVEVASTERHKGVGSSFLAEIFDYTANLKGGGILLFDGFTQDGKDYLMRRLDELSRQTGVETIFVPGS